MAKQRICITIMQIMNFHTGRLATGERPLIQAKLTRMILLLTVLLQEVFRHPSLNWDSDISAWKCTTRLRYPEQFRGTPAVKQKSIS
jgi:hypothetical protein